LREKLETLLT